MPLRLPGGSEILQEQSQSPVAAVDSFEVMSDAGLEVKLFRFGSDEGKHESSGSPPPLQSRRMRRLMEQLEISASDYVSFCIWWTTYSPWRVSRYLPSQHANFLIASWSLSEKF